MSKLNFGIIGCGDIALQFAILAKLNQQIRLTACCDVNTERTARFRKWFGIYSVFSDYQELLADDGVDAVYLSVPHDLHYQMILDAVKVGKAVFAEKPLTSTLQTGKELLEKLDDNSKVGINYQYRYDRGCYALARAVQSGQLGKVHSVRINIPWHREQGYFDKASWHKNIARAGGGTLITQGSHHLDIALWMLGERPVEAVGYTASPGFDVEVDTLTHGIVKTESGTLINITSSMVAASEQSVTIEVYGEKATGFYRAISARPIRFKGTRIRKERPPVSGLIPMQRSIKAFSRWVLDGDEYLIPAGEALPVLAAVDGIYRAAISGKAEKIEI